MIWNHYICSAIIVDFNIEINNHSVNQQTFIAQKAIHYKRSHNYVR